MCGGSPCSASVCSVIHSDVLESARWFDRQGEVCSEVVPEAENREYGAAIAVLGCRSGRFRVGKVTPMKAGVFIAVWRRADDGATEPFPADDGVNVLVVTARDGRRFGQFVFPKAALVQYGIVSVAGQGGKRGFRLYPPWSVTTSPQAQRSQRWQSEYFLDLAGAADLVRARRLLDAI